MIKKIIFLNIMCYSFLFSREFVDGIGRKVNIPEKIERVVSTAPANTEIIVDMGLTNLIVGIDNNSADISPELNEKIIFKGNVLNKEKILEIMPDLVIISEYNLTKGEESLKIYDKVGIPVYVVKNPEKLEEVAENVDKIGRILNRKDKSDILKEKYLNDLSKIKSDVNIEKKRVYFEITYNPTYTTGSGTFIDDVMTIAGGENIFKEIKGWFSPSAESLLEKNPEYIFIGEDRKNEIEKIKKRKNLKNTDAIKCNNVFFIDESINRGSTRILIALNEIKNILKK